MRCVRATYHGCVTTVETLPEENGASVPEPKATDCHSCRKGVDGGRAGSTSAMGSPAEELVLELMDVCREFIENEDERRA